MAQSVRSRENYEVFKSFLAEQMRRAYSICDWWRYLLCFRSPGKERILGNANTEPADHYYMTSELSKYLEVTMKGKQTKKGINKKNKTKRTPCIYTIL